MSETIVSSGAISTGLTISSGDFMSVYVGGIAEHITVDNGGYIDSDGTTSGTYLNSGGIEYVLSGSAVSTSVGNGGYQFMTAGSAIGTIVDSGGGFLIAGGLAVSTTVSSGGYQLLSVGSASGTTVDSGGLFYVYGGTAAATTLSAGAVEFVYGGVASGGVVDGGAALVVGTDGGSGQGLIGSGVVTATSVTSGGAVVVLPGGSASGLHESTGAIVVSTGVIEITPSGIQSSASVTGLTIGSHDEFYVLPGGSASKITLTSGGFAAVSGGTVTSVTIGSSAYGSVGSGGAVVSAVVSGGNLFVNDSASLTGVTTVEASGNLYLYSGLSVSGVVVSNGGTVTVEAGATVVSSTVDSGGELAVYQAAFGSVSGSATDTTLTGGGSIYLEYLRYVSGATSASVNGSDVMKVVNGTTSATLQLKGSYTGKTFEVTSGALGIGTLVTEVPCYCRGTRILTDRGEVAVEDLRIGDRLITHMGEARPLRWIGKRAYAGRFAANNPDLLPIRIRPGALADGVPARDLYVSPLHALLLEGVLIPARALVNGGSIAEVRAVDELEYFHLELETHDAILAEGAAAESYLDDHNRFMFQNAADYRTLYPDQALVPPQYFAPRRSTGSQVAAIRARLAQRGEACGYIPPGAVTLPLAVGANRFPIAPGVGTLNLVSSFGKSGTDQRWLGALVTSLAIDGAAVELTDGRLSVGWNELERHNGRKVRWTSGEAVVTLDPAPIERMFEIEVAAIIAGNRLPQIPFTISLAAAGVTRAILPPGTAELRLVPPYAPAEHADASTLLAIEPRPIARWCEIEVVEQGRPLEPPIVSLAIRTGTAGPCCGDVEAAISPLSSRGFRSMRA